MTENYGFTHAIISRSQDPSDFEFHIHALRAVSGQPDSEPVLIAKVDDDMPMLASRILAMLEDRGICIEGITLEINRSEPDINYIGMRGSFEDEREWTDLEVRYVDGQKMASASFPEEYDAFAYAMAELFPRPEPFEKGSVEEKAQKMRGLLNYHVTLQRKSQNEVSEHLRLNYLHLAATAERDMIMALPDLLDAVEAQSKDAKANETN